MDSPKRKSTAKFWIAIIILVLLLGVSGFINFCLFTAVTLFSDDIDTANHRPRDQYPALKEIWSYGKGTVKVARISVKGILAHHSESGFLSIQEQDMVNSILSQIKQAQNDKDVKGIILEIDSPGGTINASDEIYHAIQSFKKRNAKRKVVAFVQNTAASGAYYIAVGTDWIIAEPTAIIGSIGVIMQALNWNQLSEKLGISDITIKSGKNKDLLNPFNKVQTNQVKSLQVIVDKMYNRFLTIITANRDIDLQQLKPIADGSIYTTQQAIQLKLIDSEDY
jgi:protease IV